MEDMELEGEHFHGGLGSSSGIKSTGCDFFLLPFSALWDLEHINNKMKWNNKFNYLKYSRSNEGGLRKYLFGDHKLPSVTSILSATKSEEDKASLELWKKRVGYKEANRIKTEASSRGSSMHTYIEDYLRGRVNESFFESNEQYKNMAREIIEKGIKGKIEEIYGIEETLYYPKKYAGTAELICKYQGLSLIHI